MTRMVCKKGRNIYALLTSVIESEDFAPTLVYGIRIMNESQKAEVLDISADFDSVRSLFDLIVEEELYPEHLLDVVEDYLSGSFSNIIPSKLESEQSYTA